MALTDVLKELLSIGIEKGKPLTQLEIKNFLEATSGLKQLEQKNIIKFIRITKENQHDKITIETIKESIPYEKYREQALHWQFKDNNRLKKEGFYDEENIKKRYEIMVENECRISTNKHLQAAMNRKTINPIDYINKENRIFVEALSKCVDIKAAYNVVKTLGVSPAITAQ